MTAPRYLFSKMETVSSSVPRLSHRNPFPPSPPSSTPRLSTLQGSEYCLYCVPMFWHGFSVLLLGGVHTWIGDSKNEDEVKPFFKRLMMNDDSHV